jgi:putative tryptophan/tyrosine transport system substrate-binding protein
MTDVRGQKSEISLSWRLEFWPLRVKSAIRNSKSAILVGAMLFALSFVGVLLFTLCPSAEAQQPKKMVRLGVLTQSSAYFVSTQFDAFREGLRELGYVERQNLVFEHRYAEGELDRLPSLAGELVRIKVDLILASSTPAALAAKNATKEIPIVFHTIGDPVETGVVASLARPGSNITGLTMGGAGLYGKRLELLKETVPKLSRVAVLLNPMSAATPLNLKETESVAQALKLQVQSLEVRSPSDIELAFDTATRAKAGGVIVTQAPPITTHPNRIVDLAAQHRLPAIYPQRQWPNTGGLMSYGDNVDESLRYLASYVDRILKGAKPADLPVEQSTKLELVINLKAAKQIGLTIPANVLARADKVIK